MTGKPGVRHGASWGGDPGGSPVFRLRMEVPHGRPDKRCHEATRMIIAWRYVGGRGARLSGYGVRIECRLVPRDT